MTDKIYTDEKIIHDLNCYENLGYRSCGYAIDLINRQKAEIERFTEENRRMKKYYYTHDYHECHNEAIKEFAERLKETMTTQTTDNINEPCVNIIYYADETIDEIAKELTEGNHEQGKAD